MFNRRLKSLKRRRMYMPCDRCRKLRKTRLLKNELNTVPETPLATVLPEHELKGD